MIEITIFGRGGQGGVTLAKLIATSYFLRGKWAQAFGVYAAERTGAPIQAFIRISDTEITTHNQIREPNHIIVLDPTLISSGVLAGVDPEGWIILNTPQPPLAWAGLFPGRQVATVDATAIAVANDLGTRAVPIVNTTMMGAVANVFGFEFDEVIAAFDELKFGGTNVIAAKDAYERVAIEQLAGTATRIAPARPGGRVAGLLDEDIGAPPKIRTGTWATRRPAQRSLTPPCNHSCPAGNDVQRFVEAARHGDFDEALAVLLETTPFPGVCGRVCPSPCMEACNRNTFDEGINVRELERYVADRGTLPQPLQPWRSQQIAVIGSGPAGLSASYHLARLGYRVTLMEASDELGGVLRNGIPEYRLPKDVLDHELGFIIDHGLTVFTNTTVDRVTLNRLAQKYDGVFVATGLQQSRSLDLGNTTPVIQGIDYLDRVHRNDSDMRADRVLVVGGGNTAIDAARTARRLGASEVRILYRRSRAEMPAIGEEIDAALEEGVVLDELTLPLRIEGQQVHCVRMTLGEPDRSGRRSPIMRTDPDAKFTIACDRVILALGQSADLSVVADGLKIDQDGRLTGIAGAPVFLGGDFDRNEGTVAAAIGSGRHGAWNLHRALTGEDLFPRHKPPVATSEAIQTRLFERAPRRSGAKIPPEHRLRSFVEVHAGLSSEEMAQAEADRCFSCGVCNHCDRCLRHCPEGILIRSGEAYQFNYDYCKGCGICAAECPRGVVTMAELEA